MQNGQISFGMKGQISLESLLIWAALAGALALFTPVFSQTIHAYELEQQTLELKSHADQMGSIFRMLSFEAEGARVTYSWLSSPELEWGLNENGLELRLVDSSLLNSKSFSASSPIPLSASIQSPFSVLIFTRQGSGINIESR